MNGKEQNVRGKTIDNIMAKPVGVVKAKRKP